MRHRKRHDRNAEFVLLLSNSLIVIDSYFIGNSNVIGKAVTTALSRIPTWTPITGDSVYHSFFSLSLTWSNASYLLAWALNHMFVQIQNIADSNHVTALAFLGTEKYFMDTYQVVTRFLQLPLQITVFIYFFVLIWKDSIFWSISRSESPNRANTTNNLYDAFFCGLHGDIFPLSQYVTFSSHMSPIKFATYTLRKSP